MFYAIIHRRLQLIWYSIAPNPNLCGVLLLQRFNLQPIICDSPSDMIRVDPNHRGLENYFFPVFRGLFGEKGITGFTSSNHWLWIKYCIGYFVSIIMLVAEHCFWGDGIPYPYFQLLESAAILFSNSMWCTCIRHSRKAGMEILKLLL